MAGEEGENPVEHPLWPAFRDFYLKIICDERLLRSLDDEDDLRVYWSLCWTFFLAGSEANDQASRGA